MIDMVDSSLYAGIIIDILLIIITYIYIKLNCYSFNLVIKFIYSFVIKIVNN